MLKIFLYSFLLILGMTISQFLGRFGEEWIKLGTMFCLSFIMIRVGYDFEIDKLKPHSYLKDYLVSATTALFPWFFCAAYFFYALNIDSFAESLLLTKFSATTSMGVLFSMLAAAGLTKTWVFSKARVLAIFDDLNTVLFTIPVKIILTGMEWELGIIVIVIIFLLWMAWRFLHLWRLPLTYPWILLYAGLITGLCEVIYLTSKVINDVVTVQLEVLLPAFVFGCILARPARHHSNIDDARTESQEELNDSHLQLATTIVALIFMLLVGMSMPQIPHQTIDWQIIAFHVILVTILSNLGKMYPFFCYRENATTRERLALSIAMFPRGEVGAGVLVVSMAYSVDGVGLTVAVLSLALNFLLTGLFIIAVKRLVVQS